MLHIYILEECSLVFSSLCKTFSVILFGRICRLCSSRRTCSLFDCCIKWRSCICGKLTWTHSQSMSLNRQPFPVGTNLKFHLDFFKGLYGQNVLSTYSKAVDSAHSSVRVSSSRQSNDILGKQTDLNLCLLVEFLPYWTN